MVFRSTPCERKSPFRGLSHFWLVVWNVFIFPFLYIGNVIIPIDTIDFHIFFRGVGIPPTRFISNMMKQLYWWKWFWYIYYIQWLYPIYIYIMYKWVNKPHQFFFSWDDPPGISQDIAEPCCKNPRSWGVTWSGRNGPGWYVDLICPCICVYI